MSTATTYAFDPTGVLAANKITGEQHIITNTNFLDYNFIVPKLAPFFAAGAVVKYTDSSNVSRILDEGTDYLLALQYLGASRACAKPVYGGISFNDVTLSGIITIEYQTLGGTWTLTDPDLLEVASNTLYNPRTTSWEQITGVPTVFPVIDQAWDLVDMVGEKEVVEGLNAIEAAILAAVLNVTLTSNGVSAADVRALVASYISQDNLGLNAEIQNRQNADTTINNAITALKTLINTSVLAQANIPTVFSTQILYLTLPSMRCFVWSGTAYIRAPWDRPGMLSFSYTNPSSMPGYLPVRADASYNQANYPDLVAALGLSGTGTFSLLEARGDFLRVLDNGRGVDVSRVNGSFQGATRIRGAVADYGGSEVNTNAVTLGLGLAVGGADSESLPPQSGDHATLGGTMLGATQDNIALGGQSTTTTNSTNTYFTTRPRNTAFSLWVRY